MLTRNIKDGNIERKFTCRIIMKLKETKKKLTILAVDDDKTMQMVLKQLLDIEYDLHLTKTVAEFKTQLFEVVPDIFLLDVNLPDGDGIDLCRILREDERHQESVIMLITSSNKTTTIEKGYAAGANDFIRKPLVPCEITSKIELYEKMIGRRESLRRAYHSQVTLNKRLHNLTGIVKNHIKSRDEGEDIRLAEDLVTIVDTGYIEGVIEKKGSFLTIFVRRSNNESKYRSFEDMNRSLGLTEKEEKTLHQFKIKSGDTTIFCLLIPLVDENSSKGYILLENTRAFTEEDLEIIRLFISSFSIIRGRFNIEKSIEKMNREYKNEISKIRKIQVGFLPDFHEITGFEISSAFLPAADISGDFFDAFYLDENTFQIVLCDVSGHGIASSYIGNQIRTLFKLHSTPDRTPAEVTKNVNDILAQDLQGLYYYGTAVVIQIKLKEGEIIYTIAGHPPVLYYKNKKKQCNQLTNTGPLVGLFEDNEFENRELTLEEGDTLLLYTDGVTEASAGNTEELEMYGEDRLLELFCELRGNSARDIVHSVIGSVYEFTEYGDQEDDITLLCIQKNHISKNA